jgi:GntR family transcriptional regulator
MIEFQIDPTSRAPIYRQVTSQVKEAVARGHLASGERLPSVRELSRTLVVNPNTIAKAFNELEREGVVHARPGMGYFIAGNGSELAREIRERRLADTVDRLLTEAVHLGFSAEEVTELIERKSAEFKWNSDGKEV